MTRLIFVLFITFFLGISCAKQKPKGIIEEEKMEKLMTEVSLIDAYLNTLPIDSGRKVMPVLYQKAYSAYNLDSASFVKNMDFYFGNPVLTEKLYSGVAEKLSGYEKNFRLEDSLKNAHVQDSISRVTALYRHTQMLKDLIMNVHKDSSDFKYTENRTKFFSLLSSNFNVYGVQIPIVPSVSPAPAPVQEQQPQEVKPDRFPDAEVSDSVQAKPEVLTPLTPEKPINIVKPVKRS
ncbi:DUF4296 domain-containing protein [Sphingobacterium sp. Mn56C]|uniref:DUF4296 domain-containing protein n=1 Tax=Sphingobacterium sp. Mn56C TaxID=3395261 RepID=UPI003BC41124